MEGVEYIKYSASPRLEWRCSGRRRLYVEWVMVVEVVKVKVVG
jgi:hypothetical protein